MDPSASPNHLEPEKTRHHYLAPRVLAYLTLAITSGFAIYIEYISKFHITTLLYLLFFPFVSKYLLSFAFASKTRKMTTALVFADSVNLGILIILTGLPVETAILALMMLISTSILEYGLLAIFMILPTSIATMALTFYVYPLKILPRAPIELVITTLLCTLIYMCYLANIIRIRHSSFTKLHLEAKKQQQRFTFLVSSLSKYVSPQVWESIFSGRKSVKLENQRKKITVFFSDIKGFTELAEELEAEALTDLLNSYLDAMSRIALKHGGTIDKFIGDSIMIFFGDPKSRGPKKDALAAVSMAIEMQKQMQILRQQWSTKGIETPMAIRIGINTGYCTVGNFGAESRMDYTLIGREVNLASRLESAALPNQILLSHETWSLVKDIVLCRAMGEIQVKGFIRPVPTYKVLDLRRNMGSQKSYFEHDTKGFSITLDTTDIDDYDRKRIMSTLNEALKKLKEKETV